MSTYEISDMQGYVRWTVLPDGRVDRTCCLMDMSCNELDPLTTDDKEMAHILVPFVKTVVQQLKEASNYRDISIFLQHLPTHLLHAKKYTTELSEFAEQYLRNKLDLMNS
jgi:hypothetical protein